MKKKLAKTKAKFNGKAISADSCRKKYIFFLLFTTGLFAIAATVFYIGELTGTRIENNIVGVAAFICGVFCLAESIMYFIAGAIITALGRNQIELNVLELIVVIIVISILTALAFAGYATLRQRIVNASMMSDLVTSKNVLNMYYVDHGSYPTSLSSDYCPVHPSDDQYCLKASTGNSYVYGASNTYQNFTLYANNPASSDSFNIKND